MGINELPKLATAVYKNYSSRRVHKQLCDWSAQNLKPRKRLLARDISVQP